MNKQNLLQKKLISFIAFVFFTSSIFSDDVLNSINYHYYKLKLKQCLSWGTIAHW